MKNREDAREKASHGHALVALRNSYAFGLMYNLLYTVCNIKYTS